jgi:hypothetical protein
LDIPFREYFIKPALCSASDHGVQGFGVDRALRHHDLRVDEYWPVSTLSGLI